jgi:hypothetical protein
MSVGGFVNVHTSEEEMLEGVQQSMVLPSEVMVSFCSSKSAVLNVS